MATLNQIHQDFEEYFNNTQNLELYMKVLSWAHLNFELQSCLHQGKTSMSNTISKQLNRLGYTGKNIQNLTKSEFKKLFEKESFFSSSATGKRIAAFAIKENGLDQNSFETIEEGIKNAYADIKNHQKADPLLEQSYQHTMETLSVFKH